MLTSGFIYPVRLPSCEAYDNQGTQRYPYDVRMPHKAVVLDVVTMDCLHGS
jgi:hypothetical protein